jgi:hypothetical protein
MCSAIAYPTHSFVQQSITVAKYANPSQVGKYVLCAAAHNTYSAQLAVMCSSAV